MITLDTAYTNFPFYSETRLKQFQRNGYYSNINLTCIFSYSNKINAFETPLLSTDTEIANIKIYQLSEGFKNTKTYVDFITYRDAGTILSFTTQKQIKGEYINFAYTGSQIIPVLDNGYYEIVVTTSNNVVFESEIIKVCGNSSGEIADNFYIDENSNIYVDENGSAYFDETI